MKIKQLSLIASLLGSTLLSGVVFANTTDKQFGDDASYIVGVLSAKQLQEIISEQKDIVAYNNEKILAGVRDALENKLALSEEELQQKAQALFEKIYEVRMAQIVEKVTADNAKFVAEFKQKENVKTTESGLIYRIENAGAGEAITADDSVKVHYTGKLADGTVFDSSRNRGEPVEFKVSQVIPGWIEGLQLVKKGGKIELVIPADLAYGENGTAGIPPHSTLYFDVEILDVIKVKK